MAPEVIVTDEAFPYLVAQRGALDHLKLDRPAWEAAYRESLRRDFAELQPHLPGICMRILDVGGGMGGIDILLSRQFGGARVALLDSLDAAPVVITHDAPFSDCEAARGFWSANGAVEPYFIDPSHTRAPASGPTLEPFDLVISLQAWCFHLPPETYLAYVKARCRPGTMLVVDVRKPRNDWLEALGAAFDLLGPIRSAAKFARLAYVAR